MPEKTSSKEWYRYLERKKKDANEEVSRLRRQLWDQEEIATKAELLQWKYTRAESEREAMQE